MAEVSERSSELGRVERRLDTLLELAARELAREGCPPLPRPAVRLFSERLDAGRALPPARPRAAGTIELNRVYLANEPEAMLTDTLAHELAHLLVWHLYPRRRLAPHGPLWRHIMQSWFGVEPQRTHNFETSQVRSRRQRRWCYRCDCSEHALTTTRHKRIQQGAQYRCRQCSTALRPA